MDEYFECFLEEFGPPIDRVYVPTSSIERYRGKLPDQLLSYWQEHGWCGYADGLFWTVNPQEYEPVLDAWIGNTSFMEQDAYHIIARSAFGDLYFLGEQKGGRLQIVGTDSLVIPNSAKNSDLDMRVKTFFSSRSREACDLVDSAGDPLFNRALRKLGRLKQDEMYGFVPALALGGSVDLKNLLKVKTVEHELLLAQLAPLRIMDNPLL